MHTKRGVVLRLGIARVRISILASVQNESLQIQQIITYCPHAASGALRIRETLYSFYLL